MSRDDRDLLLKTKVLMPEWLWRICTRPVAWVLTALPEKFKYKNGLQKRIQRYPYSLIGNDDVVFQIGCPSDLLKVGRSRAGYFAHLISGNGKLVIMEPDTINCDAFEKFAQRNGFADRVIVIPKGGWNKETRLGFFQSRKHPASAVVVECNPATSAEMNRRGYTEIEVPVTTIEAVLKEHNLPTPKLISITTNGSEEQILAGMGDTRPEYLSVKFEEGGFDDHMKELGYSFIADDDRGYTYKLDA